MALLDRFRTQPRHKSPDPAVRLTWVDELPMDDREQLAAIAREDEDPRVRSAAVAKLMDPAVLASVARDERDDAVRDRAIDMLKDIALEAFEGVGEAESAAAVDALTSLNDMKTLTIVAKAAAREATARAALASVRDPHALGSIARHAAIEPARRAALDRLQDHGEIVAVAMNSEFRDTAIAALERLPDRADLEQVASRARNKSAAKRARGVLRELDEQAAAQAAAAPRPPDPAELARAERLQILQRVQALTTADDPRQAEAALEQAKAAWASVAGAADASIAARFTITASLVGSRIAQMRATALDRDRAREAAAAAARARTDLLDRVERLSGATALDELAQVQADWRQLEPMADASSAASFGRRFEQSVRASERRYASWKEGERVRARLMELADEADAAAGDADLGNARRRITVARGEWKDLTAGAAVDPALAERFATADARLTARDTEAHDADTRLRREALMRLQQLAGRVEPLVTRPDLSLKATDRVLHDLRAALGDVPPLPSRRDYDDITRRLKAAQAALTPRAKELREAEDWRRFANVGVQEQLCAKMEALRALEDAEEIARQIRDLQQQWRQAADVPRAQGEALWRRFKTAHDELWARCEAHFAAQTELRAANLAKKIDLCVRAEALAESTQWIQTAEEIKRFQAEWKTIGPVTRGQEKAVWERFRVACDRFFTRRHDDLSRRKAMWAENLSKKEALSVQAEALAESTDWDTAASEIKRLQNEWRAIGPVKKTRSEAIWQRFRGACDRFFERYGQRHDIAKADRVAAREAICFELEALAPEASPAASESDRAEAGAASAPAEPPADLIARVRALRGRWPQEIAARGVDRDRAAALDNRFRTAFDRVIDRWPGVFGGTDLDPQANRKKMEALVKRVEDLAASLAPGAAGAGGSDAALSPATRLAAMLKEALAANTIGGKVEEDTRWRAAQEDVKQAQASWSRIGPVADETRRALADRFERACRRIGDATKELRIRN